MQGTPVCNLYIGDDDTLLFEEWRKLLCGLTDSNMIKIDNAIGEKAVRSKEVPGVLLAAAWKGAEAPYTQELVVDGLLEEQNGNISIGQTATVVQRKAARDAILSITGQADGKLTITADGEKPSVDIPVVTVLLG